ncbi:GNAT family N-acetyltransferase [Arthrobacter sp. GMC3]|uniref:GNAT family N-acetyltransferase n=1 Tax=Arthrobacter sp. GMC3 TaxID=2058894 RepID=UPI000CE49048|nr:GNAT family N-acetyltransferase [Arthrobacter sp. GMC3]
MANNFTSGVYESFSGCATPALWRRVSELFVQVFAAEPYGEDPEELRQIEVWGPAQLALAGGQLVTCSHQEQLLGFALAHSLHGDQSWQKILTAVLGATDSVRTGDSSPLPADPREILILQELAVAPAARGQGIAKSALAAVFAGRAETHAVLGVYGQAANARQMYLRWGFTELGTFQGQDSAVKLHVMHRQLPWTAGPG